jgi:mRNA-degrading endonuclease RelE of RelBE toxin-antitoxin system
VNYRISIAHEAEKILDHLDRPTERRIRYRLVQLAEDPFDPRLSAPLTERASLASVDGARSRSFVDIEFSGM